jgi:molybdopterin/thiamine biosynthesis adenylyltransferase/rhodanese-related sulfurtransferase
MNMPTNQPPLNRDEILRYSRHLLIPEIGIEGQQKLKNSSVLLIGTGGLGSPAALYLAAAGVGTIGLVDFDIVDESNLQRQVIHGTSTLNLLKVDSAKNRMLDLNPNILINAYNEPLTSENAMRIATGYDVIIDGTDNFATRYLSNDVAVFLGIPNVYGSIFRFDGQLSVFHAKVGPCYRCLFPEPPPAGLVPSCSDGGVLGVLPGIIGTLQATEAIKLILGIGEPLIGKLMLFDALSVSFDQITLKKNPDCRVCGPKADITELIDYNEFCGVPGVDHKPEAFEEDISPLQLKDLLTNPVPPLLLDVREPHELAISSIAGAINIPVDQVPYELEKLDRSRDIILFCKSGTRSRRALLSLRSAGFTRLKNLSGGINRWAMDVDRDLPLY